MEKPGQTSRFLYFAAIQFRRSRRRKITISIRINHLPACLASSRTPASYNPTRDGKIKPIRHADAARNLFPVCSIRRQAAPPRRKVPTQILRPVSALPVGKKRDQILRTFSPAHNYSAIRRSSRKIATRALAVTNIVRQYPQINSCTCAPPVFSSDLRRLSRIGHR